MVKYLFDTANRVLYDTTDTNDTSDTNDTNLIENALRTDCRSPQVCRNRTQKGKCSHHGGTEQLTPTKRCS
jgi:hypothetical protein